MDFPKQTRRRPDLAWIAGATVAAVLFITSASVLLGQTANSTLAGAYSEEQADRGLTKFLTTCAKCHGVDLQGPDAPTLASAEFLSHWLGKSVGDLFDFVTKNMPGDQPGSLDGQSAADLVAYLLQANGYNSGSAELPKDTSALHTIRVDKR